MHQNTYPAHPQGQGHAEVLCVSTQNPVLFADPQPGGAPGRRTGVDKSLWPTEVTSLWLSSSTTGFTDLVCTAFSQGTRLHWVLLPLPGWGSLRVLQTCGQGIHESNYFNNTKTSRGFSLLLWSFPEAARCATLERTAEAGRSAIQPDVRLSTPDTEPTLLRKARR